jgi:hypothetical protein
LEKNLKSNELIITKVSSLNNIIEDFALIYEKENNNDYENIYNRINIYFNSIMNEIKLTYYENMKNLFEKNSQDQNKIIELEKKIISLEDEIKKYEEKSYLILTDNEKKLKTFNDKITELTLNNKNLLDMENINKKEILELIMENLILNVESNILKEKKVKNFYQIFL